MRKRRTLVIGDVHGCLPDLKCLLNEAGFRAGKDRLVFCGDLVDRGPDSAGVVRFAREIGAECVLGNHEEKHLRYRKHALRAKADPAYVIPMRMPHPEAHLHLTEADWAYLEAMPLTIDVAPDTVVVHGGFSRDYPRWRPRLQSCRVRYVDTVTGRFAASSDGISQPNPERTVFWTAKYRGTKNVIYGHHPFRGARRTIRPCGLWTLGLDTGCVFGGELTGYWVETDSFVSVQSSRRSATLVG